MNILIAEDNDLNRILVQKIFQKLDVPYSMAENGRQALDAFEKCFYELVFMDIEMPIMDGFQTTQALRKKYEGNAQKPYIVALTAHSMSGEQEKCLESGMNEYLKKPFKIEDVQRIITQAGLA